MKKLLALIISLALLCTLCACGGGKQAETNFEPADLSAKLLDSGCFTDIMSEMDISVALDIYGADASLIEKASVFMGTGATAEEIAVLKAKDTAGAKKLLEIMDARVKAQIEAYKNYVPAEVPKLEDASVSQSGAYVVYVTSADSAASQKIIEEFMR